MVRKAFLGAVAAAALLASGQAYAGGIDWATPGQDFSDSLQSGADSMIPLAVSGAALGAGCYMQGIIPIAVGSVTALYLAANSDQAQTVLGGGAGGGLITDAVVPETSWN
jgi:hypothetical protein